MRHSKPVYLDCNATTPIEPKVAEAVIEFMVEQFGNAGSRTHVYGTSAKQAINRSREQVAASITAAPDEIIFTSGATESNNLAILGLRDFGERTGRKHIISSQIEHKAVLEPLEHLSNQGFDVDLVPSSEHGTIEPESINRLIRADTLLVSIMHVNNETGMIQPIREIAASLSNHDAYFHVDAAQGFGKRSEDLKDPRIDMLSISGHKIFAPKGVGALVVRRRGYNSVPLQSLMFGGGQERSLRPGTLPVELIVGLGVAAELSVSEYEWRRECWISFRENAIGAIRDLNPIFNGDPARAVDTTINFSIPGVDSEALMVALKDEIAISNGSACTSQSYTPSHVLRAMGLPRERIQQAIRVSWCHLTEEPDWKAVRKGIQQLL